MALSLLALTAIPALPSSAETIAAKNLRQNLFASCFPSDSEGWMVGDLGRIFHTVDGGQTWVRQDAGTKRPFVGISCPDKDHIYAAGQTGEIAKSSDGGNSWTMLKSNTDRMLLDVAFSGDQRGMAVGDFGTIVRTDDGGQTWTKIKLPTDIKLPPDVAEVVEPGDILLYAVTWVDPEHVWVAGEFGTILASSDGGLNWQQQTAPVQTTLFGIFFADQQRGWAVGLESTLLATTDGGMTWAKQNIETPPGFFLALYDVQVRGNYGWAIGNSGFLLNSMDAGRTWQLVTVPVQMRGTWFRSISLLPTGHGYIVGETGMVLVIDQNKFKPLKELL